MNVLMQNVKNVCESETNCELSFHTTGQQWSILLLLLLNKRQRKFLRLRRREFLVPVIHLHLTALVLMNDSNNSQTKIQTWEVEI